MYVQRVRIAAYLLSLFFIVASSPLGDSVLEAAQAQSATLEGTVHSLDGEGIGSVRVVLKSPDRIVFTDDSGTYSFGDVAPGSYLISFHYGGLSTRAEVVQIRDGITLTVDKVVETDFRLFMSVSVTAVSRRPEPVIDAPAAVTTVGSERIELEGGGRQIPALLQFTPGVEYTQSGVYDINLNTRGFNSFLTRRIQTLVDGRDAAAPDTSSQEWYTISFLTLDLESVEFVRGPSGALYGANSVNGVMTLKTKAPRDSQGTTVRLTGGELDSFGADFRWAGALGNDWYMKFLGSHSQSSTFTRSRNETVEYEGLPRDTVALPGTEVDVNSFAVRFDKYTSPGVLTMEGGLSNSGGETFVSAAGRFHMLDTTRSWMRVNFNSLDWNLAGYVNDRSGEQLSLAAGVPFFNDGTQVKLELQGNQVVNDGRTRLVFGGSYMNESLDSKDPNGTQTLYSQPIDTNEGALFGQVDFDLTERVKLVGALRWDDSTLHETQISPKAYVVLTLPNDDSLRFGFNRSFEVGNYTQLFLDTPTGPPLDLSALEAALSPVLGGVSLGLESVGNFARGNPDLDVEKIRSFEAGYRGKVGNRLEFGVDYYRNRIEDFISDLLPGINPFFPPYRAPAELDPVSRAIVEQTLNSTVPGLTNDPVTADPLLIFSFVNTGKVDSQGFELDLDYQPDTSWRFELNYSWFDFDVKDETPGVALNPNAPTHKAAFAVVFQRNRLSLSAKYRWVNAFDWASGIYAGPVSSYSVADVNALFSLSEHWQVGANVSNLLDNEHYEMFGGDILGRRALGHLSFRW